MLREIGSEPKCDREIIDTPNHRSFWNSPGGNQHPISKFANKNREPGTSSDPDPKIDTDSPPAVLPDLNDVPDADRINDPAPPDIVDPDPPGDVDW